MRILIDECIDRRLRDFLAGHECQTARYAGFGGLENGALLTAAENAKFDVLMTVDRGIEFQQDLGHRNIAILILCAKSIRLKDLPTAGENIRIISAHKTTLRERKHHEEEN